MAAGLVSDACVTAKHTADQRHNSVDLTHFGLDPVRGFLPAADPLGTLDLAFGSWEETSHRVPSLLMAGRAREVMAALNLIDATALKTEQQLWRAYVVLTVMAQAYVLGGANQVDELPRELSLPLCRVAAAIGMPPTITYAAIVLNNWSRIDSSGPLELGNLMTSRGLAGGTDEEWFFLTMVAIEASGGPALQAIWEAQDAVQNDDAESCGVALDRIAEAQRGMLVALDRLKEQCDPYIFFHRIRPVLDGWNEPGVIYAGVSNERQVWVGPSGTQSSLIQALDITFGVTHHHNVATYLEAMRAYMPPGHRRFLRTLQHRGSVREYAARNGGRSCHLATRYQENIRLLVDFRRLHAGITARYVSRQTRGAAVAYGTGGTDFVPFLKQAGQETAACLSFTDTRR